MQTVTACPFVRDIPAAIDFLTHAFNAVERARTPEFAEIRIGDTVFMIVNGDPRPMAFRLSVPDIDAAYQRALDHGATSLEAPANIKDPFGNHWYLATGATPTIQPFLHPLLIDFLTRTFDAFELVPHALKIGTSTIQLSDAAPSMPGVFYLYVADADAVYARALQHGAESIAPPADQPHGDRNARVRDIAGNEWYIATRLPAPLN